MILIIDNYDSFTYNLYQQILEQTLEDVVVHKNDEITISEIKKLNPKCIILSPGPGKPEDSNICLNILQELSANMPILGVCLGHQAIAINYGGEVGYAKFPLHGKGREVFHEGTGLFKNIPNPFIAARYHSLIVDNVNLPDCITIDAKDINNEIMALSHKEYQIYGIQFHPESILTKEGNMIMRNFLEIAHVKTLS